MALEGPRIVYTRTEDETPLARALRLMREVEELLEDASSDASPNPNEAHSTRIARALAASLVDELQSVDRQGRRSRLC
jgi:hypothetical protein